MATRISAPVPVKLGVNFPKPEALQTGDVLFARNPTSVLESADTDAELGSGLTEGQLGKKLPDFLGPRLTTIVGARPSNDRRELEAVVRHTAAAATLAGTEAAGGIDTITQTQMAFLLAILKSEFEPLFRDWFNLSVGQFIQNPLARVLFKALEGDIGDGFFVGHCGLVLRDRDGAHADNGTVYVIEANATSFDHYRVNMRPYHLGGDGADGTGRYRSWTGYRASRGDSVWSSRHVAFGPGNAASATELRTLLLRAAQTYQGRSYGFFDTSTYADAGRLYCSEFIHRACDDVRLGANSNPPHPELARVDDRCTWDWIKKNNPPTSTMGEAIQQAWNHPVIGPHVQQAGRRFFILTVQMLWRSGVLSATFKPKGDDYG